MSNQEKPELKPIYMQETMAYNSDSEISLIDMTLVLIKHKKLLGLIFIICTFIGLAGYLLTSSPPVTAYNLSTSIKIGHSINDGRVTLFETPETLLAKIQSNFIPELLESSDRNYAFSASNPRQTELIILKISGHNVNDTQAAELLNKLIHRIEQDHNQIYSSIKSSLELSLKSANLVSVAYTLASLQKTHAVSAPIMSITTEPLNKKPKMILTGSLFFGLILGIFAAFFTEFIQKVKDKQKEINNVDA